MNKDKYDVILKLEKIYQTTNLEKMVFIFLRKLR